MLKKLLFLMLILGITGFASALTWNGSVSSDWSYPPNWDGGIPGSGVGVEISGGKPNDPVVGSGVNAEFFWGDVWDGAVLTIEGTGTNGTVMFFLKMRII